MPFRGLPWLCVFCVVGVLSIATRVDGIHVQFTGPADCNTIVTYQVLDGADGDRKSGGGQWLFQGGDIAFFANGNWCSNSDGTLLLDSRQSIDGDDAALGRYTGEELWWNCNEANLPIVTRYKNFVSSKAKGTAILFETDWPRGAPNTSLGRNSTSALTNYPSLIASPSLLGSAVSWHGSFAQSFRAPSTGPRGGPTVFYNASDPTLETVVVASPWNGHWKTYTAGSGRDWQDQVDTWAPGTSARIVSLPQGFQQSILLFQGQGGITNTLAEYGAAMQASRDNFHKLPDVTLTKIGYQTDNGAYYCFCNDTNCSQTLLNEVSYLRESGIELGYLSFQGAGASTGRREGAPWCIHTWGVDGGLGPQYPLDLASFQKALNLPLQLYAPYFCPESPYFGNWPSLASDTSLPGCDDYAFRNAVPSESRAFYNDFLGRGVEKAGMASFESDFMNQNFNCVPEFIQSTLNAETWQQGMASAALNLNVPIQWCYATPTDVLASLDMPAVTNFRVSFDYCYGESWNIGESSLLVWALGASPSKDTFWTTDNNRTEIWGCKWTDDHDASAAELHLILALLSTGPLGFSDGIGMTDFAMLKRAISQDGTLLQPSKPITAVDSSFLSSEISPKGYVYGTSALGLSWIFVHFLLQEDFMLTLSDFWPSPTQNTSDNFLFFAYRLFEGKSGPNSCVDGSDAVSSGCVEFLRTETLPSSVAFRIQPADSEYATRVSTVWRRACNDWFFLGELDKYVALSPSRFEKVLLCNSMGFVVRVKGRRDEIVHLTALERKGNSSRSPQYSVVVKSVRIPRSGSTLVTFGSMLDHDQDIE
jgi:hypothetical protein